MALLWERNQYLKVKRPLVRIAERMQGARARPGKYGDLRLTGIMPQVLRYALGGGGFHYSNFEEGKKETMRPC